MVGLGMGVGAGPVSGAADGGEPGYRAYSSEGSLSGELCTSAVVAGNNNGSLGIDGQDACAVAGPGLQTFQMQLQGCPVEVEVEDESCACGHLPISPLPPRPHQPRQHVQRAHGAGAGAEEATVEADGDGEALAHPDEEASAYRGGSQRPAKSEYTSTAYADPSRLSHSHAHEASPPAASPQRELFDPRQKAGTRTVRDRAADRALDCKLQYSISIVFRCTQNGG